MFHIGQPQALESVSEGRRTTLGLGENRVLSGEAEVEVGDERVRGGGRLQLAKRVLVDCDRQISCHLYAMLPNTSDVHCRAFWRLLTSPSRLLMRRAGAGLAGMAASSPRGRLLCLFLVAERSAGWSAEE